MSKPNLTTYRYRWMEGVGRYVIEKRHDRLALGFWPVYVWEGVHATATGEEAVAWILAQRQARS